MEKMLKKVTDETKCKLSTCKIGNQEVYKIGETIIGYATIDEKGNPIYETDLKKFPSSCTKKHIKDCVEAGIECLGKIRRPNWKLFNDDIFTVIDIETTGFSPDKHSKIIEIGCVKINKDGFTIDRFSRFINPGEKITKKITELTQITNDMVENELYIGNVMVDFWNFIRGTTLVFHNSDFDWDRFLTFELGRKGIYIPKNYPYIDTLDLDKYYFPEENSHKLNLMCERLGIDVENHHRAIYDAEMTAKAFIKFREMSVEKYKHLDKTIWNIQDTKYDIKINSTKFWGKFKKDGTMTQGRIYIEFKFGDFYGSGYYDILEDSWYMKSSKRSFLIDKIEDKVLEFIGYQTREELKNYRGTKKMS